MPACPDATARDGRAARWAGQREKRRTQFVEAAVHAIARHGPQTTTEQIAESLGVTRTKLYRYFDNASELNQAVARRAGDMLFAALAEVWSPIGIPYQIVTGWVGTYVGWVSENSNLYRYVIRHAVGDGTTRGDVVTDIKTTIGTHFSQWFTAYWMAFGVDPQPARPLAFGIVGFMESATTHWLDNPAHISQDELISQLAQWVWCLIDNTLQAGGVHLDPNAPLADPRETTALATDATADTRGSVR